MSSVWEKFGDGDLISAKATEDLRSYQWCWVKFYTSSDELQVMLADAATDEVDGILQNTPNTGEEALVAVHGFSKCAANAALAVGTYVTHEYVSATDVGKAADAKGAFNRARGLVVYSSDAEDDLCTVQILPRNPTKIVLTVPIVIVPNTTTYYGFLANMTKKVRITSIAIAAYQVPADADGTILLNVLKYDVSAPAEVALQATADFDVEAIAAAKTAQAIAVSATAANLVVDTTDFCYVKVVNNSAALTTADQGLVVTVEGEIVT